MARIGSSDSFYIEVHRGRIYLQGEDWDLELSPERVQEAIWMLEAAKKMVEEQGS